MPIYILEERFELARDTLLKFIEQDIKKENTTEKGTVEKKSIEEDTKSREFVVLSGVSLEEFHKLRTEARKFKIYIRLVNGEVIAYEMPSPPRTYVAGHLIQLIGTWSNYFEVGPELDMNIRHNTGYISDVVVEPMQPLQPLQLGQQQQQQLGPTPGSTSQPRMIIEIGTLESFGSLHSLAREYFSTSAQTNFVQVYLTIKIFPRRTDNTAAMVATIYLRDNRIPARNLTALANSATVTVQNTRPNLIISFGTSPLHHESADIINSTGTRNDRIIGFLQPNDTVCSAAGMPDYQINIPSNLLFNGFPGGVPQGTPNNFKIDLWEIQQIILRRLR